jgi:hypothetical protein
MQLRTIPAVEIRDPVASREGRGFSAVASPLAPLQKPIGSANVQPGGPHLLNVAKLERRKLAVLDRPLIVT